MRFAAEPFMGSDVFGTILVWNFKNIFLNLRYFFELMLVLDV
jgi:hypothetical protein